TVWVAHAQCELARMLLACGKDKDRERANELITSARQTAQALDLVRLWKKLESGFVGEKALKDSTATPTIGSGLTDGEAETRSGVEAAGSGEIGSGSSRTRASKRVERLLTAIFAADVAGYSRLTGMDEEGTHIQLKEHLRTLINPK